jgi:hypothetical protein
VHRIRVQFSAPRAGNIVFAPGALLTCPAGSNFVDSFGGLYEDNSYPTPFSYCSPSADILVSTLDFQCAVCPMGQYSLRGGYSTGSPGAAVSFPCLPCPVGGVCEDGAPVATPGFWGAANDNPPDLVPNASFAVCPTGYCCDGSEAWPCVGMGPCAGHRDGPLCGDCQPGYAASLGSAQCVPVASCATDKPVLWAVVAVGEIVAAVLQLTVVSGVWASSSTAPTGRMKLLIYFVQVCVHVCWGCSRGEGMVDGTL